MPATIDVAVTGVVAAAVVAIVAIVVTTVATAADTIAAAILTAATAAVATAVAATAVMTRRCHRRRRQRQQQRRIGIVVFGAHAGGWRLVATTAAHSLIRTMATRAWSSSLSAAVAVADSGRGGNGS